MGRRLGFLLSWNFKVELPAQSKMDKSIDQNYPPYLMTPVSNNVFSFPSSPVVDISQPLRTTDDNNNNNWFLDNPQQMISKQNLQNADFSLEDNNLHIDCDISTTFDGPKLLDLCFPATNSPITLPSGTLPSGTEVQTVFSLPSSCSTSISPSSSQPTLLVPSLPIKKNPLSSKKRLRYQTKSKHAYTQNTKTSSVQKESSSEFYQNGAKNTVTSQQKENSENFRIRKNKNIRIEYDTLKADININEDGLVKSHTRKCREKVSRQLECLAQALPTPSGTTKDFKHKGQLLQHTVHTIKYLFNKRLKMQAGMALSSTSSLQSWANAKISEYINVTSSIPSISSCVSLKSLSNSSRTNIRKNNKISCNKEKVDDKQISHEQLLSNLFESFLNLYCSYYNWTYGELWLRENNTDQLFLSSDFIINSDNKETEKHLKTFYDLSKENYSPNYPKTGTLFRAMASCSDEWVSEIGMKDNQQFERYSLTKDHGLKCLQIMPISSVFNHCEGVLVLGDINVRSLDISVTQSLKKHVTVILEQCTHRPDTLQP